MRTAGLAHLRADVSTMLVDGRPTRLLDVGSGPVVVCCPGIASTLWDWAPLVELLRHDVRVVVVERAGYAPGEVAPSALPTLEGEARHLVNTLEALGVTEPVTFVGHSFGAVIVEAATRLFPGRVRDLVLLDGSVPEDEDAQSAVNAARWNRRFQERARPLLSSSPGRGAWRVLGPAIWASLAPGRLRVLRAVPGLTAEVGHGNVITATARELAAYPACMGEVRRLRETAPLRVPTLVVAANGRLPRRRPTAWVRSVLVQARDLAKQADVRTVVLDRCGHFVMLDRTRRVAELVLDAAR